MMRAPVKEKRLVYGSVTIIPLKQDCEVCGDEIDGEPKTIREYRVCKRCFRALGGWKKRGRKDTRIRIAR